MTGFVVGLVGAMGTGSIHHAAQEMPPNRSNLINWLLRRVLSILKLVQLKELSNSTEIFPLRFIPLGLISRRLH